MSPKPTPTYSLSAIQASLEAGNYRVTRAAGDGAAALYLDGSDIRDCVLALEQGHFRKTMESHYKPGAFQDVYKTRYCGYAIYVKLTLNPTSQAVVISFKQDQDP
jgi:hypothetical protein